MPTELEILAEKIGQQLKQQRIKLATAESCTGGGLSYWLTSIPGSSDWFERGFVTYSNAAKIEMLGVKPLTLNTYGAVSKQTAIEMAEGAIRHSTAEMSIATTGIAGPSGGSPEKPVGTVWIAWAKRHFPTYATVSVFTGNREDVRICTIQLAFTTWLERNSSI